MPRRKLSRSQNFVNYARGTGLVAGAAFTALKVATGLAALINTEVKFIDHEVTAAAVALPATTLFIHGLAQNAQGTDEQLRIGNSILPKALNVRLQFSGNTSGGTDQTIRYMIVIDRDQDGTPPTVVQLLQLSTKLDSFLNMDNKKRFRVLVDGRMFVGNASTSTQHPRNKYRSHYLKFNKPQKMRAHMHVKRKWYHILYSGSDATNASMDNGQIYIMAWSNEVTNSPTLRVTSRLRFIDN